MLNLEEIKNKLIQEREEIILALESINKEEKEVLAQPVYETSDFANVFEAREEIHLTKEKLEERLKLVEHALKKIDEGKYGLCDHCHRPIEEKRLLIDPAVNLCRECAEKYVV